MSSFLKLSKICINTKYIRNIDIKQSNYEIKLATPNIDIFFIFGSGGFDFIYPKINICEQESKEDYNIIKKWLLIQEEKNK